MDRLTPAALRTHLDAGARALDVREPPMYAEAHLRGSLNVALSNRSAPYWVHTLIGAAEAIVVITATEHEGASAARLLEVSERRGAGYAAFDREAFERTALALASIRTLVPPELAGERGRLAVIDVREPEEWVAGHVPGALWIPLAELPGRLAEVPRGPVATICASGFRSSSAASLLEAAGREDLANVWGGTTAWIQLGFPVHRGKAS